MLNTFRAAVVLALFLPAVPAAQGDRPSAVELAESLQRKYDAVRDFSADFVHAYRGGLLRKEAVERGVVLIRKPGLMRWTYTEPERKVFVSDGTRFYAYVPADRQVVISRIPGADQATTPALFLAGKGRITRDFTASYPASPDPAPGTYTLTLTPRTPEDEYDRLTLVLDRATLVIRKLITHDTQGGQSTFTFTNLRENTGIPDKEFRFTIPRGVDVIDNGQPVR